MPRRARSSAGRASPALAVIALLGAVVIAAAGVGGYAFVATPYTWTEAAIAEARAQGWELAVIYEGSDPLHPWSYQRPYPATLGFTRPASVRRSPPFVRAEAWWWSLGRDGQVERWQSGMLFHCTERVYALIGVDTKVGQIPDDASARWNWSQMTPELVDYFCAR
jgi:hypothetical protein